jgi:hypothetical protein
MGEPTDASSAAAGRDGDDDSEDGAAVARWLKLWLWLLLPVAAVVGALIVFTDRRWMPVLVVPGFLAPGGALTRALATWPMPAGDFGRTVVVLSTAGVWAGWVYLLVHLGGV